MKNFYIFVVLIVSFSTRSQSMGLDTTFGNNGIVIDSDVNEAPRAIIFQDNKYFFICNNTILSKNYDGSVNTTFGTNGKIAFANATNTYLTKNGLLIDNFIYIFGQVHTTANSNNKNIFITRWVQLVFEYDFS